MPAEGLPDSARLDSEEPWKWISSKWVMPGITMDREVAHEGPMEIEKVTFRQWRKLNDGSYHTIRREIFYEHVWRGGVGPNDPIFSGPDRDSAPIDEDPARYGLAGDHN